MNLIINMKCIVLVFISVVSLSVRGQSSTSHVHCNRHQFMCSPNLCIYDTSVCDGNNDCLNNRDEEFCGKCQKHLFGCSDGKCIRTDQVCNGSPDCNDGEDEKHCGTECYSTEFSCKNGQCIFGHDRRCNGIKECDDGSDELECDSPRKCIENEEFTCHNGTCISENSVCDGVDDCPDGFDEQDCPSTCSSQETTCEDGRCVSSMLDCYWSSMNSTDKKDESQTCLLSQGCLAKVLGLVFGLLGLVSVILGGALWWWYRQKVLAGESHYSPLGRHLGRSSSNEAITMDQVT